MDKENFIIRKVEMRDALTINKIYNHYILTTDITFETEPLTDEEMQQRIANISAAFPYFVCESRGEILGYCYVHLWKDRAAYAHTLETTIYLRPDATRRGIGLALMHHLIGECRNRQYRALIACITAGNTASIAMHHKLGFEQVSEFKQVGRKFNRWLDVVDLELLL